MNSPRLALDTRVKNHLNPRGGCAAAVQTHPSICSTTGMYYKNPSLVLGWRARPLSVRCAACGETSSRPASASGVASSSPALPLSPTLSLPPLPRSPSLSLESPGGGASGQPPGLRAFETIRILSYDVRYSAFHNVPPFHFRDRQDY